MSTTCRSIFRVKINKQCLELVIPEKVLAKIVLYLFCDEIEIEDVAEAESVCNIAKKLNLNQLAEFCVMYQKRSEIDSTRTFFDHLGSKENL
jgi:hypothetical protein